MSDGDTECDNGEDRRESLIRNVVHRIKTEQFRQRWSVVCVLASMLVSLFVMSVVANYASSQISTDGTTLENTHGQILTTGVTMQFISAGPEDIFAMSTVDLEQLTEISVADDTGTLFHNHIVGFVRDADWSNLELVTDGAGPSIFIADLPGIGIRWSHEPVVMDTSRRSFRSGTRGRWASTRGRATSIYTGHGAWPSQRPECHRRGRYKNGVCNCFGGYDPATSCGSCSDQAQTSSSTLLRCRLCSGNGVLVDGECACDDGFNGTKCDLCNLEVSSVINGTCTVCSGNGEVNESTGRCKCHNGFNGTSCATLVTGSPTTTDPTMSPTVGPTPTPTSSPTANPTMTTTVCPNPKLVLRELIDISDPRSKPLCITRQSVDIAGDWYADMPQLRQLRQLVVVPSRGTAITVSGLNTDGTPLENSTGSHAMLQLSLPGQIGQTGPTVATWIYTHIHGNQETTTNNVIYQYGVTFEFLPSGAVEVEMRDNGGNYLTHTLSSLQSGPTWRVSVKHDDEGSGLSTAKRTSYLVCS